MAFFSTLRDVLYGIGGGIISKFQIHNFFIFLYNRNMVFNAMTLTSEFLLMYHYDLFI